MNNTINEIEKIIDNINYRTSSDLHLEKEFNGYFLSINKGSKNITKYLTKKEIVLYLEGLMYGLELGNVN